VVNLGNPVETSVAELAGIVCELTGVPLRSLTAERPPDDPTRRRPDIALAQRLLAWEPRVALRDGLAATIAAFRR
jgi:UDP-glucuronate decarboxylase